MSDGEVERADGETPVHKIATVDRVFSVTIDHVVNGQRGRGNAAAGDGERRVINTCCGFGGGGFVGGEGQDGYGFVSADVDP